MQRYLLIVCFVIVLGLPFLLRAMRSHAGSAQSADATSNRIVIVTPHAEGVRREFAQAFAAWYFQRHHQSISVDYRNYGGTNQIVQFFRASQPLFNAIGNYKIDLAWGGGDYLFESQLKKEGYLEPLDLGDDFMREVFPQPKLAGLPLYDTAQPPRWFGSALSSFGICFNFDVVRYLQIAPPGTWRDLADPKYRGWIVLADPTLSGAARTAFMVLVQRAMADAAAAGESEDIGWARGMGLLRQIAANARLFTDASSAMPGVVASGDAAAAMVIDYHARSTIELVGDARMAYVEPPNATSINPDPIALVRGAEHREAAVEFIKFVLSDAGQRLWITKAGAPNGPRETSLRRLPVRRDVYDSPKNFTDHFNPFAAAMQFNSSPARMRTYESIGDWIEISMMDPLDELRKTRQAILASPRAAALDAKLGMFPFDQSEALRRAALFKQSSPADQMRLRREWTAQFVDEYRRLREEALQP